MLPNRNLIANILGQSWVAFVGLAFVPVYIDRLGVEAYGLIGFYILLQVWFSVLDLGMSTTTNREMSRARAGVIGPDAVGDLLRSLEIVVIVIASCVALGLFVSAEPIARYWLELEALSLHNVIGALQAIAFVVASRFCEGLYRGALFGLERQVFYNLAFAGLSTLRYSGAALIVIVLPSIEAFFLWQAGVSMASVAVFAIATHVTRPRAERRPRFSAAAVQSIGGFAGGLSLTTLIALVFTQIDKVMLSRMVDLESFGLYMIAFTLAGVFAMMTVPSSSSFFPRLTVATATGDRKAERYLFHAGAQLVAIFACPLLAVMLIAGEPLVHAWTGDAQLAQEVSSVLALLAVGGFCNAMLQIPYMLQLSHGWTTLSVRINFLAALLLIPSVYLGVSAFGIVGAAVAWAGVNLIVFALGTIAMHRRLLPDERMLFLWDAVAIPLFASGSVVGAFTLFMPDEITRIGGGLLVLAALCAAFLSTIIATPIGRVGVRHILAVIRLRVVSKPRSTL